MRSYPSGLIFAVASLPALAGSVTFEPNRGQAPGPSRFLGRTAGGSLLIESGAATVVPHSSRTTGFRWTYPGSSKGSGEFEPRTPTNETKTYILGSRKSRIENVPTYRQVAQTSLYAGIGVLYRAPGDASARGFEYDFFVSPGADPSSIRVRFEPGTRLRLFPDGSLEAEREGVRIRQPKPVAYTEADGRRLPVQAAYRLVNGHEFAFDLGPYSLNERLVIDPEVQFLDYAGGTEDDEIQVASLGLLAGRTRSWDFIARTASRFQGGNASGGFDVFVSRRDFQQSIVGTTVIGGSGNERVYGITPVFFPWTVIVGETDSRDFPASGRERRPLQQAYGGGESDGFYILFDSSPLEISYFGGSGADRIKAVATTGATMVFAGETDSPDIPGFGSMQAPPSRQDVFLTIATFVFPSNSFAHFTLHPTDARLVGGDGADFVNAVSAVTNGSATTIHIAGETRSMDFPLVSPLPFSRRGPSDAFWLTYELMGTDRLSTAPSFSTLWGGAGEDRFTAIALRLAGTVPEELALAGESSSPELPDPSGQGGSPGGELDAVVVWVDPITNGIVRRTYVGGSRDEHVHAAVFAGDRLQVAGSTSSLDLPVREPVHAGFGGGLTDGLLVRFGPDRSPRIVTYMGGSGDETIRALLGPGGPFAGSALSFSNLIEVYGRTDSQSWSFPLPRRDSGSRSAGPLGLGDGLVATIDAHDLPHTKMRAAPGYLSEISLVPFNAAAPLQPLTLTVDDPALALIARDPADSGSAQLTVTADALNDGDSRSLPRPYPVIRALASSGVVRIAVSAPGFAPGEIKVELGSLAVRAVAMLGQDPALPAGVSVFRDLAVVSTLTIRVGSTSEPVIAGRPDPINPAAQFAYENLTPDTLRIAAAEAFTGRRTFRTIAVGSARVRVTCTNYPAEPAEWDSRVLPLGVVTGPIPVIGTNLQSSVVVRLNGQSLAPVTVRVTSVDPNLLRVSLSRVGTIGSEVETRLEGLFSGQQIFLQAAGISGVARLRFEGDGIESSEVPVRIEPSEFVLRSVSVSDVFPGQAAEFRLAGVVRYFAPGFLLTRTVEQELRADASIEFQVVPENGSIARSRPPSVLAGGTLSASVFVDALAPGSTVVSALISRGPSSPRIPRAELRVASPGTQAPRIVGANLEVSLSLGALFPTLPPNGVIPVTITSSRPDLVLLRRPFSDPAPAASIAVSASPSSLSCVLVGQASEGEAEIRISTGTLARTISVRLAPSAAVWTQEKFVHRRTHANQDPKIDLAFAALDAATGMPVESQIHRQDKPVPPIRVETSDEGVAVPVVSGTEVTLAQPQSGSAALRIVQPAGFANPAHFHTLEVTLLKARLPEMPWIVGTGLQAAIRDLRLVYRPGDEVTIRSGDPARLILSTSAFRLGEGEIRVLASSLSGSEGQFYLQALGEPGDVPVTVSAPLHETQTLTVRIRPSSLVWIEQNSSSGLPRRLQRYTLIEGATHNVQLRTAIWVNDDPSSIVSVNQPLRPGLEPLQIALSVDPARFATVTPEVATLNPGSASIPVSLTPRGIGLGAVSVRAPAMFSEIPRLLIEVEQPGFASFSFQLGRDTQIAVSASYARTVREPAPGTVITARSSDPSKVLLSLDANQSGAASVSYSVTAGVRREIFVQGVSGDGTAFVELTGPGLEPGRWTVRLRPSRVVLSHSIHGDRRVPITNPADFRLDFQIDRDQGENYYFSNTIRPGVRIPVELRTSSPEIAIAEPASFEFAQGTISAPGKLALRAPGTVTFEVAAPPQYLETVTEAQRRITFDVTRPLLDMGRPDRPLAKFTSFPIRVTFPFDPGRSSSPLTIRSEDPSRILLSVGDTDTPVAQLDLTVRAGAEFFVHGVSSSGTASIVAEAPGHEPVRRSVTLSDVVLRITNGAFPRTLTVLSRTSTLQVEARPAINDFAPPGAYRLSPLAGRVEVVPQLSNPAVVRFAPASTALEPGHTSTTLSFSALAIGSTLVSLRTPAVFGGAAAPSGTIDVVRPTARLRDGSAPQVGRYLQQDIQIDLNFSPSESLPFTVRSLSPEALFVSSGTAAPSGSATFTVPPGSGSLRVTLHGRAATGSSPLVVETPGHELLRTDIGAVPSGFAFANASGPPSPLAVSRAFDARVEVWSYALTPGTLAPSRTQPVSPVVPANLSLALRTDPANVVTGFFESPRVTAGVGRHTGVLRGRQPGAAEVHLVQPEGFSAPSMGNRLDVRVD